MAPALWTSIRTRTGQFWRGLTARVAAEEVACSITHILQPEAQRLFLCQPAADQRHALAVCRALQEQGEAQPELLAAALLHDVGKARARLSLVHRTAVVLSEHWAPRLLARLSREPAAGGGVPDWRRPFVLHARHAQTGARWACEAGCAALTVALIEHHHEQRTTCCNEEDRLLSALQNADSQC